MSLLSEDSALVALPGTRKPPCVTAGGPGTTELGYEEDLHWANMW
jgi:hypothetical protein